MIPDTHGTNRYSIHLEWHDGVIVNPIFIGYFYPIYSFYTAVEQPEFSHQQKLVFNVMGPHW